MKPLKILFSLSAICLLALFLLSPRARAETCEKWVAKVVSAQGGVQSLRAGERQWRAVKLHETYCPGDRIRVLIRGRADIVLFNETTLRLDQNTTVSFSQPEEKTSLIELLRGAIHFLSRHRRSIRVVTPFVNATVEGTEFYMEVEADKTLLHLFEGLVTASNQAGKIRLTRGQSAMSSGNQSPVLHTVVRPRDAIRWTLYYPSIFDYRPSDFEP
ncbi:MAG TPA: FecR family protein, partial [Thermodesulfobacteriota bacterium]|nr:FecR family protein [Thermodesulfobacteriota bacterium]